MGKLINLHPGQRLRGIPSETWNAHNDAVRQLRGTGPPAGTGQQAGFDNQIRVLTKNSTGGDLDQFSVVTLQEPLFDVTDDAAVMRRGVILKADSPTNTVQRFGILQAACKSNGFAPAAVRGLTWAKVDKQTDGDTTAGVETGTTANLKGGIEGASIVWAESGTGVKWAIVDIGRAAAVANAAHSWSEWSLAWTDCTFSPTNNARIDHVTKIRSQGDLACEFDNGVFRWNAPGTYDFYMDNWINGPINIDPDSQFDPTRNNQLRWKIDLFLYQLSGIGAGVRYELTDSYHFSNFGFPWGWPSLPTNGRCVHVHGRAHVNANEANSGGGFSATTYFETVGWVPHNPFGDIGRGPWQSDISRCRVTRIDSALETPAAGPPGDGDLLLENGDRLLLESGDDLRIDT